jgi:hypothetical protein
MQIYVYTYNVTTVFMLKSLNSMKLSDYQFDFVLLSLF